MGRRKRRWYDAMIAIQRLRDRAARAQGGCCHYCGVRMMPAASRSKSRVTADHIQARAHGGRTVAANIVACCWACNAERGTTNPSTYRQMMRPQDVEQTVTDSSALEGATVCAGGRNGVLMEVPKSAE